MKCWWAFALLTAQIFATEDLPHYVRHCPIGWTQHDTSCYKYFHDVMTFDLAKCHCFAERGILGLPESPEENDVFARVRGIGPAWIATMQTSPGTWRAYRNFRPLSYSHWANGQPHSNYEHFACAILDHVDHLDRWRSVPCNATYGYICKTAVQFQGISSLSQNVVG